MDNAEQIALVEGALFLSSHPLPASKIASICETSEDKIREYIIILKKRYEREESALTIVERQDGYLLGTKPSLAPYLEKLYEEEISPFLSQAALETLAIIAYKQPVTRPEIEQIRGVSTDGVLEKLLQRRLIKTAGRKNAPGRPLLYITTDNFLRYFGLKRLEDLPSLKEEQ